MLSFVFVLPFTFLLLTLRLLFIGDIVGKPGRKFVAEVLPELKKEKKIDVAIANVENLAHGKGITNKTLDEVFRAGVDYCTSGNHVVHKDGRTLLADPATKVLRPANFPDDEPGKGFAVIDTPQGKLLLINLIGQVFFKEGATYKNPFHVADAILKEYEGQNLSGIIVDWHAEATSEKVAIGYYLDGRVSAVLGTHTHVTTDDLRILPGGTAYRTDCGMTGLRDDILGADREAVLHNFLDPEHSKAHWWGDEGAAQFHATLVEIDASTGKATAVEKIDKELEKQ